VEGEGAYVNSIILTELMTKTPFLFYFFLSKKVSRRKEEEFGAGCVY
jgi:hypothetical protein